MGQDPPRPKRKQTTPANVPTVRQQLDAPLSSVRPDRPPDTTLYQTGLPTGPDYEVTISRTDLHVQLELSAGTDDEGYYKFCPGNDGKSWYLSYRWKRGRWAGHYCMAVVLRGDLRYGVCLLGEKIELVRRGLLRPTLDRFGD